MEEKIFRNTRMQLGILISRGVTIKNKRTAKKLLRDLNYYNLINGYKDPFLQPNLPYEKYLPGTTLAEIYALYEFDRKLRVLTLEYILKIETQVKSRISYHFSRIHGHKNYLKLENFDTQGIKKYDQVCKLLSTLYKKITLNINKDLSVSHYVGGKNHLPLWVLVNTLSMGDISKFYSNMIQSERSTVARNIKWGVREHELTSCLFFLSTIRNRCAHDERLFSYLSYIDLCSNKYFRYFHTPGNSTNNYFSAMIAFKMLLPAKHYQAFHEQLQALFHELNNHLTTISLKKIRHIMGVPNNWNRLKTL